MERGRGHRVRALAGAGTRRRGAVRCGLAVVVAALLSMGSSACGDPAESGGSSKAEFASDVALPFGLEQVAGTVPVGRPAVFDDVPVEYNGVPVTARSLQAAYQVLGDDPVAVFRAWVDQLKLLHAGEVTVQAGEGVDDKHAWLQVSGGGYSQSGPEGDSVNLQLWTTDGPPVLLVGVQRYSDDGPETVVNDRELNPRRPESVTAVRERGPGEVLFEEQNQDIHVPDGSRALMGTVPISAGTGGSYSVLAADDGAVAVQSLLDDAIAGDAQNFHEVTGPLSSSLEGVEITRAAFVIPAGGWGFDIVAVQAKGDPWATVYITSNAD